MKIVSWNCHYGLTKENIEQLFKAENGKFAGADVYAFQEVLENEFNADYLKYVLYSSGGNQLAKGDIPKSGVINLANNIYLEHGLTARYTLIVWLQDNGKNQYTGLGEVFSGKIDVTAIQVRK